MRSLLLILICLVLLACSQKEELDKEVQSKPVETVDIVEADQDKKDDQAREEFPVPDLNPDNIKLVNDLVMEQLTESVISDSRRETADGKTMNKLPVKPVAKPEIEIDIPPPVFEIEPEPKD